MKTKALIAIAAGFLFGSTCPAQTGPVRLLVSNGVKAVMLDLQPQIEKATGHPVAMVFDSTALLKKRMDAGEPYDVAILTANVAEEMIKDGKLVAASRAEIARAGVGVGTKAGTPKPDIHDAAGMKKALLATKSITYAENGASRPFVEKMFDKLGIAAELKPKVTLVPSSDPATESVAEGKIGMVITLVSEIMPVKGLQVVGEIPAEFQSYISFIAATNAKSTNTAASGALIAFLKSPKAAPVYKAKGMEAR